MSVEKLARGAEKVRVVEGRVFAKSAARDERLDHLHELDVDASKGEAKRVGGWKVQYPRIGSGEVDEVGERARVEEVDGSNHAKAREELDDGGQCHAFEGRETRQGVGSNHLDTSHQGWWR